jgi:superfamily II RNA helicase
MAGRAGRRGLDTVGHVIHLNNLFRDTSATAYKTMMNGKPQTLTSKFKISYNLLLNLIDIGDNNLVGFAKKSMVIDDLNGELRQVSLEIDKCTQEVDRLNSCIETMRTPRDITEQYNKLQSNKENYANKKRKEMEKEIQKIKDEYKYVDQDLITLNKISQKMTQLDELTQRHKGLSNYLDNDVNKVLHVLTRDGFLTNSSKCISLESEDKNERLVDSIGLELLDEEITDESFVVESLVDKLQLSLTGKMASGLREVHCLVFARLLEDETITNLSVIQLIALFSCFTNISVQEGVQDFTPRTDDDNLKQVIYTVSKMYSEYEERESMLRINTGADYTIHYDLLNYVEDWTDCECVEDCRDVLSRLSEEKEIFLGEFVKALLKINNISCEMEQIAEQMGNIEFLSKLKQIPELTLKYVVTNQSLYV